MAPTATTITHQFTNADGTPASGSITATLTKRLTNGTVTIVPAEITANLDANGQLSMSLYSNADAGSDPTDTQWRVEFRILGAASETFFITVPVGPATVDLGSLLPQVPTGG